MKKIPFWAINAGGYLLAVALTTLIVSPLYKLMHPAGDDRTNETRIESDCLTLANRYGFSATNKELCAEYVNSEKRARQRLDALRHTTLATTYCAAKYDFNDAYDLERWILDDAAFRMAKLGVKDGELRDLRIAAARRFAAEIKWRIKARSYDGTNCPVDLRPDNFVFRRWGSIETTAFSQIEADHEEVLQALYWRRMTYHGSLPRYDELPQRDDILVARAESEAAYNKKYGK